jgi:hypothetical protein
VLWLERCWITYAFSKQTWVWSTGMAVLRSTVSIAQAQLHASMLCPVDQRLQSTRLHRRPQTASHSQHIVMWRLCFCRHIFCTSVAEHIPCVLFCFMSCAGAASPTGSARVSVPKVVIGQDSIFAEVEVALQDEPAWQVCLWPCCHLVLLAAKTVCQSPAAVCHAPQAWLPVLYAALSGWCKCCWGLKAMYVHEVCIFSTRLQPAVAFVCAFFLFIELV